MMNPPDEALIEAMARAAWAENVSDAAANNIDMLAWHEEGEQQREMWRSFMRAAFAGIQASGTHKVVPLAPRSWTASMTRFAVDHARDYRKEDDIA